MPVFEFMTIIKGPSGLATDRYVNTWHFHKPVGAPATDFDNVRDMLKDFYNSTTTGTSITALLAPVISTTVDVKAYNLEEPKPRAPAYESSFALVGLGGSTSMAFEVALCLSFEAAKISGEIQRRRRNRVYLGPFSNTAVAVDGRPSSTLMTNIFNCGKALRTASETSTTWDWVVWSPTDNESHAIQHIWVDNAWDTQRRRGNLPTARSQIYY